ncbi:MAG: hypothetical protein AAB452_01395 [Patescibacteria group bacterium]
MKLLRLLLCFAALPSLAQDAEELTFPLLIVVKGTHYQAAIPQGVEAADYIGGTIRKNLELTNASGTDARASLKFAGMPPVVFQGTSKQGREALEKIVAYGVKNALPPIEYVNFETSPMDAVYMNAPVIKNIDVGLLPGNPGDKLRLTIEAERPDDERTFYNVAIVPFAKEYLGAKCWIAAGAQLQDALLLRKQHDLLGSITDLRSAYLVVETDEEVTADENTLPGGWLAPKFQRFKVLHHFDLGVYELPEAVTFRVRPKSQDQLKTDDPPAITIAQALLRWGLTLLDPHTH